MTLKKMKKKLYLCKKLDEGKIGYHTNLNNNKVKQ